jgi:hypothetical protein
MARLPGGNTMPRASGCRVRPSRSAAVVIALVWACSAQAKSVMFTSEQPIKASFVENRGFSSLLDQRLMAEDAREDVVTPSGAAQPPFVGSGAATNIVPEPSTWSLLLIGFLGLALVALRRQRKSHRRFRSMVTQEFDPRRFRGRLQTAFSLNDSEEAQRLT